MGEVLVVALPEEALVDLVAAVLAVVAPVENGSLTLVNFVPIHKN